MRQNLKSEQDPKSQAHQESLKFTMNTLWGNLTSAYFDMVNVVCSEIVTAEIRIRTRVWMMSKALNTHFSITDGGPYSLMLDEFNVF
jgi:hypothetical protein